ncbi:MAG: carbamoyltransferase HypF [Anaerolineales bacterium]|nr:carbamoyltransferase HypF [Anaerolineales bacterium]
MRREETDTIETAIERRHIHTTGVVQGVGFRPFVYGLAHRLGLDGWVFNSSDGVDIEIQGTSGHLAEFIDTLRNNPPPLAHIDSIDVSAISLQAEQGFKIKKSVTRAGASLISPDVATCSDCLKEIQDPADRRYRYPFTNCTNCGPRFTIIQGLPYDRPLTTMAEFMMCPECQKEYDDPLDRRFHAQPNACPVCGPRVWISTIHHERSYNDALATTEDPFKAAASLLRLGGTMAIKGLGGFHLACDATNEHAVRWLRRRKGRPAKPLAVMMADMDMVRRFCRVSAREEELLLSAAAPIVLLWRKTGTDLALALAPRNRTVGVMLPYTPLHYVLMAEVKRPLVMTSGNHTDEPIAQNNDDAMNELGDIADAFLFHNRFIHARADDSVWMVCEMDGDKFDSIPIRRSRGYAPFPIKVAFNSDRPIFGAGAQMKNVFAVLKDNQAFMSQHIGELDNLETLDFYHTAVDHLMQIFKAPPAILAHDMHPDYLSTRYVREWAARDSTVSVVPVQHHHAHIAGCLADNLVNGPVIGVALDGTGYGTDAKIWGCEFLLADLQNFQRVGHLEYLPLPGGEGAIRRPYRIAMAYLQTLLGEMPDLPFMANISQEERRIIYQQVERGLNTPLTSSCGRLFDAVAALIGVRGEITYEAQAAIELEMITVSDIEKNEPPPEKWLFQSYPYEIDRIEDQLIIRVARLFSAIIDDLESNVARIKIGRRFHATLAHMVLNICLQIRDEHNINTVALSGGCFQNRLLLRLVVSALRNRGFKVLTHQRVPPNDGGIALGQVAVAAHRLRSA